MTTSSAPCTQFAMVLALTLLARMKIFYFSDPTVMQAVHIHIVLHKWCGLHAICAHEHSTCWLGVFVVLYIERKPFDEPTENVFSQIEPQKLSKTQQNPNPATTQHNGFVNSGGRPSHPSALARAHNRSQLSKLQSSPPQPSTPSVSTTPRSGTPWPSFPVLGQPTTSAHPHSFHRPTHHNSASLASYPWPTFCGLWRRPHFAAPTPARAHTHTPRVCPLGHLSSGHQHCHKSTPQKHPHCVLVYHSPRTSLVCPSATPHSPASQLLPPPRPHPRAEHTSNGFSRNECSSHDLQRPWQLPRHGQAQPRGELAAHASPCFAVPMHRVFVVWVKNYSVVPNRAPLIPPVRAHT